LIVGFIFIVLSNIFGLFVAPLVRKSVNLLADQTESLEWFEGFKFYESISQNQSQLALFVASLILLSALLKGVFMFFMRQTIIVASRHIEFDLKNEIYQQYQRLDKAFFTNNYTGDLMNRISEDVSRVRQYVGPAVMYTLNLTVLFVLVIGMMVSINARITLWVLLPLPFMAYMVFKVSSIINRKSDVIQEKLSDMTTYVQEALSGIRVLKSFGVDDAFISRFDDQNEVYRTKNMSLVKTNALFMPSIFLLVGASVLLTVWVGGKAVIAGEFTYGNIAEYIIYVNMLTWPMISVGWVTSLVQRAAASQARINRFLEIEPTIIGGKMPVDSIDQSIVLSHITFGYEVTKPPVLLDLNLEIKKGQHVGIIGNTGCGKSTIAALLTRTFDPDDGEIILDGTPVSRLDLPSYRKLWGYVPQDVFLFSDTVEANIAFGLEGIIEHETIEWAAIMAGVHEDIMGLPKGYKTTIGERGVMLSGGQKQRLAIARALAKKPQILLLDDSLSAVDTTTEKSIKENLKAISKDTTLVTFSHRISTIEDADVIYFIQDGAVLESGTLTELIHRNGAFSEVYQQQTVG
jgi:ATP-binding cassette subfamily B protein